MTKPKFKKGDRVVIVSTPNPEDSLGCVDPMRAIVGEVHTIEAAHPANHRPRASYDIDGWAWWGYNLRLVEEEADG